jgi:hypothetical protein
MKVTESTFQIWLDRLLKDERGQAMFSKRGSNFNRSTKKEDIALLLEAIWAQHQQGEGGGQLTPLDNDEMHLKIVI